MGKKNVVKKVEADIKNIKTFQQVKEQKEKQVINNFNLELQIHKYQDQIKKLENKISELKQKKVDVGSLNGKLNRMKEFNADASGSVDRDGWASLVLRVNGKWVIPTWKEGKLNEKPELVEVA